VFSALFRQNLFIAIIIDNLADVLADHKQPDNFQPPEKGIQVQFNH
jgi:hypothetical protein